MLVVSEQDRLQMRFSIEISVNTGEHKPPVIRFHVPYGSFNEEVDVNGCQAGQIYERESKGFSSLDEALGFLAKNMLEGKYWYLLE